jgi:hypothetical protein
LECQTTLFSEQRTPADIQYLRGLGSDDVLDVPAGNVRVADRDRYVDLFAQRQEDAIADGQVLAIAAELEEQVRKGVAGVAFVVPEDPVLVGP